MARPNEISIGENKYVSVSMGALWVIAGACVAGLILLITGIAEGQRFIDSFNEFKATTLKYEKASEFDRSVVAVKVENLTSWQKAADERRNINHPLSVNLLAMQGWARALSDSNADLLHADPLKRGLVVPVVVPSPTQNLPEATILPLPVKPDDQIEP